MERFFPFVNPGVIPAYIAALTGVDDAMVPDAPTFSNVLSYLERLLQEGVFVVYNVNFLFMN